MFDLLIRGDRVVTPHGVGQWDIAIKDGKIATIGRIVLLALPTVEQLFARP